MDYFSILLTDYETKLLVFARVLGIFAFNPLLSRRNVPQMVKIGMSVLLAIIASMVVNPEPVDTGEIAGVYLMMLLKEGFIGLAIGFISDMFFQSVQVAGEMMDMQSGLGMAKVFDPVTNSQSSLMGSIISFMLYLYYFAINAHHSYIKIFVLSYNIIPIGNWSINPDFGWALVEFFSVLLALVLKMALPIIVSEIILQFAMGVMMKSVPQIQLMVVNIQLKVAFGFWILFVVAVPLANFIDGYIVTMYETIEEFIPRMIM